MSIVTPLIKPSKHGAHHDRCAPPPNMARADNWEGEEVDPEVYDRFVAVLGAREGRRRVVYPRIVYTDLNRLWLLAEWH